MQPDTSSGDFGPTSEAGVGLVCECGFQTADERKADAHYSLTGHLIAFDYLDLERGESDWPTLPRSSDVAT